MPRVGSRLDLTISRLTAIRQEFNELRERLRSFPPAYREDIVVELRLIANELEESLRESPSPSPEEEYVPTEGEEDENQDGETGGTATEKMILHFRTCGNKPATIDQLVHATGAARETVRSILYKRNRGRFVQTEQPTVGSLPIRTLVRWRLSDGLYQKLKDEEEP